MRKREREREKRARARTREEEKKKTRRTELMPASSDVRLVLDLCPAPVADVHEKRRVHCCSLLSLDFWLLLLLLFVVVLSFF